MGGICMLMFVEKCQTKNLKSKTFKISTSRILHTPHINSKGRIDETTQTIWEIPAKMSIMDGLTSSINSMFPEKTTYGEGPMTKPKICDSIMDCIGGTPMVCIRLAFAARRLKMRWSIKSTNLFYAYYLFGIHYPCIREDIGPQHLD